MPHPFLVTIVRVETSYFGVEYDFPVLGFGCRTAEERDAEAAKALARENARLYPRLAVRGGPSFTPGETETRAHRAIFRMFCEVCRASGTKPGCKKKRCEACAGVGSIADAVAQ